MIRKLIIRPEAEVEITEAHEWYQSRVEGLGSEFLSVLDAVFQSIVNNPKQYQIVYKNIRRALTKKFPYEVFYIEQTQQITVLAVFHAKRNPVNWRNRN